jgi:hypothetical protein
MPISGFWSRVRAGWQAFRSRPEAGIGMPGFQQEQPRQEGFTFPPGTRPVIIKTEESTLDGMPHIRFKRGMARLRDRNNAKIMVFQTNRIRLPGCNCFVSGPNDVAYLSDISGLPVCRACASTCHCGHKVAPHERVLVARRAFVCRICHEAEQRQLRRTKILQFLLGPFIRED